VKRVDVECAKRGLARRVLRVGSPHAQNTGQGGDAAARARATRCELRNLQASHVSPRDASRGAFAWLRQQKRWTAERASAGSHVPSGWRARVLHAWEVAHTGSGRRGSV